MELMIKIVLHMKRKKMTVQNNTNHGYKKITKLCLLNIQSVTNKTLEIRELIAEKSLDILALTETWLSNNDSSKITELVPDTHIFYDVPRGKKRGGGVGLCLSKRFTHVKMIKSLNYTIYLSIYLGRFPQFGG